MEYDAMEQYWIWLSSVEGMTPKRFYPLIEYYGDARAVWDDVREAARMLPEKTAHALIAARDERTFYQLFARLDTLGITAVSRVGEHYPARLTEIYDPPPVLYALGDLDFARERAIGVVGSRRASRDGKRAATEVCEGLAREGVSVVSGMARGIDTAAHQGALSGAGHTVAVLGSGLDVIYPPENDKLQREILSAGGAVLSEYVPGTPPYATNFPARNRIISGLSRGVLMVEGRKNSGAMITMNFALDQSRDVFAVPGSIYSPLAEGPNQLLYDGAQMVRDAYDILESYHWASKPSEQAKAREKELLGEDESKIVEKLRIEALSFDELALETGFNSAKLNSLLTILELRGIIKQLPGRLYRA